MGLIVNYPADVDEWYAKGTTDDGVYFEVPAVFNADGTCDEPATLTKVEQSIRLINERP